MPVVLGIFSDRKKVNIYIFDHEISLFYRQVSILMDVKEPGEIELTISYLVWGASWTPRYDIRAFSEDAIVKVRH